MSKAALNSEGRRVLYFLCYLMDEDLPGWLEYQLKCGMWLEYYRKRKIYIKT